LALDTDAGASPLEVVRALRLASAELDADPAALRAVRAALEAGASWSDVARAAQLSPAASRWRWQGDDAEIAARHEAGRKRSERPSSKPADLPGLSVAEAATQLGVTAQAIYLRVSRGQLRAETVTLPDGRSYKRVFPE
jgi:transposase-like protein